ncbi:CG32700 [Drosophila busckii]|uniref:CG32700 n=1 Tax=Drosophila busckii TaxID=30019 RepID=A0A0M4EUT3_DROBS|nr:uncharacterized protein LOC108606838 [Drosophila busckii]ALC49576.1 CG32700 [Drosophila busckii]
MDTLRLRGPPFKRPNNPNHPQHPRHPQHAQVHAQIHHPAMPQTQEPLIVVEESNLPEELDPESTETSNRASLDIDSPVNPYLLSPWRDPREARKHSLPSQQVTDGITASQVRRLSERGGEGSGPSPKEAAFLATLSQAPAPSGRRHSVVTISKVPTTLFGRSRRESVAAYPSSSGSSRVLSSRRESNAGPPSTDPIGSIHNLQLDIMDDIHLQSRKARLKLWNSSSEKVCEVQTVEEAGIGAPGRRYTNRRYSECPPPGMGSATPFRRGSEHPQGHTVHHGPTISPQPTTQASTSTRRKKSGGGLGILGSRSDLACIFGTITGGSNCSVGANGAMESRPDPDGSSSSSAATGNSASSPFLSNTFQQAARGRTTSATPTPSGIQSANLLLDPNAGRSTRSNSFDVSILNNAKQLVCDAGDNSSAAISGWFGKKSTPSTPQRKKSIRSKSTAVALSKDVLERLQKKDALGGDSGKPKLKPRSKKKSWADATKANIVDATMLGTAIEGFLRKSSNAGMSAAAAATGSGPSTSAAARQAAASKGAVPKEGGASTSSGSSRRSARASAASTAQSQAGRAMRSTLNWFSRTDDEDDSKDTCDASLCSALKDLFVK